MFLDSATIDKKLERAQDDAGDEGGFYKTEAMRDALYEAANDAIERIKGGLNRIEIREGPLTPVNCEQLTGSTGARILVVIPETHLRRPRIPDPAGETEIIRKFLEEGFNVVDQKQIAAIRYQEKVLSAVNNPQAAAALGVEFGADIIVIGEAFSEFASRRGNKFTCRARVEARAIQTSTGKILAAHGIHASGLDITEHTSGKVALRNAGSQMGEYFISQLCEKALEQTQTSVIEVLLTNVTFPQLSRFASFIETLSGIQQVQKSLTGNTARLQVQYNDSADHLADAILNKNNSGLLLEITNLTLNKINITITGEAQSQK